MPRRTNNLSISLSEPTGVGISELFSVRRLRRTVRQPVCVAKLVPLGRTERAVRKVTVKAAEAWPCQSRLKLQEASTENDKLTRDAGSAATSAERAEK